MSKVKVKTNKANRIKMSSQDRALEITCYIIFLIAALICLYPFYYILINTISANDLSAKGDVLFWPKGFHLHNYTSAFQIPGLLQATLISVLRTVIGTTLTVFACAYLGYMFTQEKRWGRKVWYRVIVITMYFSAGIIPWYIVMRNMHLTNNFW